MAKAIQLPKKDVIKVWQVFPTILTGAKHTLLNNECVIMRGEKFFLAADMSPFFEEDETMKDISNLILHDDGFTKIQHVMYVHNLNDICMFTLN